MIGEYGAIESVSGARWRGEDRMGVDSGDSECLVPFVRDGKVVQYVEPGSSARAMARRSGIAGP